MMASPQPYTKRRFPSNTPPTATAHTRPSTHLLCKSLCALFLLSLPFLPAQPPDFLKHSRLTNLWELLHLLFVGIAVSYGLFSRRNVDMEVDSRSSTLDDSHSYMSGMLHVSSSSSEGCMFDDKKLNSGVYAGGSVICQPNKFGSFSTVENEHKKASMYNNSVNEVQAWNSQYFQGESMVVVAQPSYGIDGYIGHRPLGLPVRSLRSGLKDNCTNEFSTDGTESGSSAVHGSSNSSTGSVNSGCDYLGPGNSTDRASSSVIPWRSRSERVGIGESTGGTTSALHFRPLSVDETQFEYLKSRFFPSAASFSSPSSCVSHNESRFSPANSVSSESCNSKVDDLGMDKSALESSRSPSLSLSPSPSNLRLLKNNSESHVSHSRHYSHGSLLDEDVRRSFEYEARNSNFSIRRGCRKDSGPRILKVAADKSRMKAKSFSKSSSPDPSDGEDSPASWHSQPCSRFPYVEEDVRRIPEDDCKISLSGQRRKDFVGRRHQVHSSLEFEADGYLKDDSFYGSYSQTSHSSPVNVKPSLKLHARDDSNDDLFQKDLTGSLKDGSEHLRRARKDYFEESMKAKLGSLGWESKPGRVAKALSRGKSVRTLRGGVLTEEVTKNGVTSSNETEGKGDFVEDEAGYMGEGDRRSSGIIRNLANGTSDVTLGYRHCKPKQRAVESLKREEKCYSEICDAGEGEVDGVEVSLEKEASIEGMKEEGNNESNEVDRKAGEFIAKFREQIRLQKQSCVDTPRSVSSIDSSYFR